MTNHIETIRRGCTLDGPARWIVIEEQPSGRKSAEVECWPVLPSDYAQGGAGRPAYVNYQSTSSLSADGIRAFAQALTEAASLCDRFNA